MFHTFFKLNVVYLYAAARSAADSYTERTIRIMAEEISKSKAKRLAVQEEERKRKQKERLTRLCIIAAAIVIVALIAAGIISSIVRKANTISPSTDYSRFLNEDGTIRGIDVNALLPGFKASDIKVDEASITADQTYLDSQHLTMLNAHQYADDDPSLTVKEGDTINLDYVGTVDGEEFEGGSTGGNGTTLEIGSGTYVDDFEDQLVGTHPGDSLTVSVTFPDDYSTAELQGKDAEFAVTVNGIMTTPEWSDEFVAENYADTASTMAEYDEYLKNNYRQNQLTSAINDYFRNDLKLTEYPKKYLRHLESLVMNEDQASFEQMKAMYSAYGLSFPYGSFEEYNANYYPDGYEAHLEEEARVWMGRDVASEIIAKANGLTVSDEDLTSFIEENGLDEETVESVGRPYLKQAILTQKAETYLEENCDIGNYPAEEAPAEEAPAEEAPAEEAAGE